MLINKKKQDGFGIESYIVDITSNEENKNDKPLQKVIMANCKQFIQTPSTIDEKDYTSDEVELPPDGGYGWICVCCISAIQFSTWGNNSGFGVFLAYYLDNDIFTGAKQMDFAWIAGLITFNAQLFAPLAMISVKMIGFKTTMTIGCIFHCIAYILASFATQIWQLYVCQGVIVGICYSFISFPALSILPDWFLRRRGIASGIVTAGTGLGGVFYALTINTIIEKTGNQRWALRMVGICSTFAISISIFFIRRRSHVKRQDITLKNFTDNCKSMFDLSVVKTNRVWYISIWLACMIFFYNIVIFSYSSFATSIGLTAKQGSILTAVLNAAQCIGRPSLGVVADYCFGRVNYSMILNCIIFILVFGFWMNAKSFISLIICSICFGLVLGLGNVMGQVFIADAFKPEEFVCAWSISNLVIAVIILFVEVIALALRDESLSNPYYHTQIFAGTICVFCLFLLAPLREWNIRELLIKTKENHLKQLNELKELNVEIEEQFERKELEQHIEKLDHLLQKTPKAYFRRLFYLSKV